MKGYISFCLLCLLISCNTSASKDRKEVDRSVMEDPRASVPKDKTSPETPASAVDSLIGESMEWKTALPVSVLDESFDLEAQDLVVVKGKVTDVCQKKGCWMKLDKGNGEKIRVTFKDYALFMPKDLSGREVVIRGKVLMDTLTVDDLRHYAEDDGQSPEEIAKITEPETQIAFEADGVAILKPGS